MGLKDFLPNKLINLGLTNSRTTAFFDKPDNFQVFESANAQSNDKSITHVIDPANNVVPEDAFEVEVVSAVELVNNIENLENMTSVFVLMKFCFIQLTVKIA